MMLLRKLIALLKALWRDESSNILTIWDFVGCGLR